MLQDPAARRATAAATRSVSRERFGLGAAIRILDEMKFPTLGEMKFPTRGEVDFGVSFWQPRHFWGTVSRQLIDPDES